MLSTVRSRTLLSECSLLSGCSLYCQDTLQLRDRGPSERSGLASGEILVWRWPLLPLRAMASRAASYVIWSGHSTSTSTGPVATKELELERRAPLQTPQSPLPLLCHILEKAKYIYCKCKSDPKSTGLHYNIIYISTLLIYLSSILLSEDRRIQFDAQFLLLALALSWISNKY